jgi:hypothetical protein
MQKKPVVSTVCQPAYHQNRPLTHPQNAFPSRANKSLAPAAFAAISENNQVGTDGLQ